MSHERLGFDSDFAAARVRTQERAIARIGRRGYLACGVFACTVGAWTATATISGAVVAPASFVVENNSKKIQHPQGGIVAHVQVREGDRVQEGDLLLRLDDTATRSAFQIVSRQIDEGRARAARLEAERDRHDAIAFPADLTRRETDPDVAALMASERRLFSARIAARNGMRAQLAKRVAQLQDEISGMREQLSGKTREAEVTARELEGLKPLFAAKLVSISRVSTLEREAASLEGARGQLKAQIAQAGGKIAETELQIIQIDEDLRAEALRDLREVEARLSELVERHRAAEDSFRRMDIRAPSAGYVHQLTVHNAGAVVNPSEPVMLIVPTEEKLFVETKISPQDYDLVHLDQPVLVRIHAFNQRMLPELNGSVARMAADVSKDAQTGASLYTVRVAIPPSELARIAPLQVTSGMQAEALIKTSDRTPFAYLLRPLADQIARAFRER
jgi:HlyD family secretion protein